MDSRRGLAAIIVLMSLLLLAACGGPAATALPTAIPSPVALSPTSVPTVAQATPGTPPRRATTVPTAVTSPSSSRVGSPAASATPGPLSEVALPVGSAYLSPDGGRIAWTDGKSLCLYSSSGQRQGCDALKNGIDVNSVRWSPDSRHLAYTENFFQSFIDPDIWVMDAASGTLSDLTDDQVDRFRLDQPQSGNLDVVPTWSSDSTRLIFIRYLDVESEQRAALYTIGITGGTPTQLRTLNSTGFATFALAWSPDGQRVAYNIAHTRPDDPENGLWIANLDGSNPRQLLGPQSPTLATVVDLTFSADGRTILANLLNGTESRQPITSLLVPADGGSAWPVDGVGQAQGATWSPDGTALAYLVRDPSTDDPQASGLFITTQAGTPGKRVQAGRFVTPIRGSESRPLTWARNNTILVLRLDDLKFLLLRPER